jgi:hypothetical protein
LFSANDLFKNYLHNSWAWWLVPIIPATWKAEIEGSLFEDSLRQKNETLSEK